MMAPKEEEGSGVGRGGREKKASPRPLPGHMLYAGRNM